MGIAGPSLAVGEVVGGGIISRVSSAESRVPSVSSAWNTT